MPSPTGNRNLALQYLTGLIEEGYKNTEIVRLLREEGLSYRTQTMFADINRMRLENFGATEIRGMGFDDPIPEKWMRERNVKTPFPYSVVVKYDVTDPTTGLTFETGTTMYFAEKPSQAEALSYFALRAESGLDSGGNVIQFGEAKQVYYYRNNPQ